MLSPIRISNNCKIMLNIHVSWINMYKKEEFRFNIVLNKVIDCNYVYFNMYIFQRICL